MEKSIIIVGAGIAGLSAGIYARKNGYKTSIIEMHSIPGGLCTAWKRKGYTWDISMHLLTNSRQGPFHKMWEELGVVTNTQFFYHHEMVSIESGTKKLSIGTNKNELLRAMLEFSPADKKLIKQFISLLYGKSAIGMASLKPPELSGPVDTIKMLLAILPMMGNLLKFSKSTIQDFALRFKDPFLRNVVRFIIDSPFWPMVQCPTVVLSGFLESSMIDSGVPLGGSQKVVFDMAETFQKLGGEIIYKNRVCELIIENSCIRGVKLENGAEYHGNKVIWAADGHHLIYGLLGGQYMSAEIKEMYENWIPVLPLVQVMMGVNRDLSAEPFRTIIELEKPIIIAGEERRWMGIIHHSFDPSMAPQGKSSVEVWFPTKFDYWKNLSNDKAKYNEEKKRISDTTIAELDKKWPGFSKQVEVVDVPTPLTYERYTGNWKGSPDGWYITTTNMTKQRMLRTLPGLQNLYMIGQWTAPYTGTVMAAVSGRQIMEIICKTDGKNFKPN